MTIDYNLLHYKISLDPAQYIEVGYNIRKPERTTRELKTELALLLFNTRLEVAVTTRLYRYRFCY